MSAITVTAAQVAPVNETEPEIKTYIAAAAITAGQAVYENSAGKVDLAKADAVGTAKCVGIALRTVGAGQAVSVLQRGTIAGFTLSGAYASDVYVSAATAGSLDSAIITGTGNVVTPVGMVTSMSDADLTKVLWIDIDLLRVPVAL
jgi:hypothetical protein